MKIDDYAELALRDMRRASEAIDTSADAMQYQVGLIALALSAREFIRRVDAAAGSAGQEASWRRTFEHVKHPFRGRIGADDCLDCGEFRQHANHSTPPGEQEPRCKPGCECEQCGAHGTPDEQERSE